MNILSNTLSPRLFSPRLLAGAGVAALIGAVGLVSSRPAHSGGGPVPVTVANAPLYVIGRDSDSPARHPVSVTQRLSTTNRSISSTFYTVPAGKRLVIEYVSSTANIGGDVNGYNLQLSASQGGGVEYVNFNELPDAAPYSAASQSVRLYADAGTDVRVAVYSSQNNDTDVEFTFSGYLVDVP